MKVEHIKWRETIPNGDYTARRYYYSATLYNTWTVGGILYGYRDRFNIACIALEDIYERS